MEDFLKLVAARQSDRAYDMSRPVEPEKLERILEAARLAPSACNAQPWKFVVINDPELSVKPTIIKTSIKIKLVIKPVK